MKEVKEAVYAHNSASFKPISHLFISCFGLKECLEDR